MASSEPEPTDVSIVHHFLPIDRVEDIDTIMQLAEYLGNRFSVKLDRLIYAYWKEAKPVERRMRFSRQAQEKLRDIAACERIWGVDAIATGPEKDLLVDSHLYLSFDAGLSEPIYPGKFSLVIKSRFLEDFVLDQLMDTMLAYAGKLGIAIRYGRVFPMESRKEPSAFATGIASGFMTKEEEEIAWTWSRNKRLYRDKVLDVFWGNYVHAHLIGPRILEELVGILGSRDCIQRISPDLLFFRLPVSIFDTEHIRPYRDRIRELLVKHDLLMPRKRV